MSVNYVDYDAVSAGRKVYEDQAAAINEVISTINKVNEQLRDGWSNETARAFVQRISDDHVPKLQKASEAIQEVADYINTYLANKQDEDKQGASAISG